MLAGLVEAGLKELIRETAAKLDLEIMPDHLHLFVNAPLTLAPHVIAARIEGVTSRRHIAKMPSMWTRARCPPKPSQCKRKEGEPGRGPQEEGAQ